MQATMAVGMVARVCFCVALLAGALYPLPTPAQDPRADALIEELTRHSTDVLRANHAGALGLPPPNAAQLRALNEKGNVLQQRLKAFPQAERYRITNTADDRARETATYSIF